MKTKLDHRALAALAQAGATLDAEAVGREGGWALTVRAGKTRQSLAAQRGQGPRLFARVETLVAYLKGVGIESFRVDAAGFALGRARAKGRPDRAAALRETHAAAVYDKWFRAEVAEALAAADREDAQWVGDDDAKRTWARKRAKLLAGANKAAE